jgi:hypothetical protein
LKTRRVKIKNLTKQSKTVTSLHFPNPAVIDLERGTDYYDSAFNFEVLQTTDIDEVNNAIDELIKDPRDRKTLVIDPFTVYWDQLQDKHQKRLRVKKGNPNYVLQPLTKDGGMVREISHENPNIEEHP